MLQATLMVRLFRLKGDVVPGNLIWNSESLKVEFKKSIL